MSNSFVTWFNMLNWQSFSLTFFCVCVCVVLVMNWLTKEQGQCMDESWEVRKAQLFLLVAVSCWTGFSYSLGSTQEPEWVSPLPHFFSFLPFSLLIAQYLEWEKASRTDWNMPSRWITAPFCCNLWHLKGTHKKKKNQLSYRRILNSELQLRKDKHKSWALLFQMFIAQYSVCLSVSLVLKLSQEQFCENGYFSWNTFNSVNVFL